MANTALRALLPPALVIVAIFLSCSPQTSASEFLSRDAMKQVDEAINFGTSYNRRILQIKTPCSVKFQVQNYTIITSECKGPVYPANACCTAFVKFACPFAAEINDNTTDCADTMFNYISVIGHYPAGLFANECMGADSRGLPCPPGVAHPPSPAV